MSRSEPLHAGLCAPSDGHRTWVVLVPHRRPGGLCVVGPVDCESLWRWRPSALMPIAAPSRESIHRGSRMPQVQREQRVRIGWG